MIETHKNITTKLNVNCLCNFCNNRIAFCEKLYSNTYLLKLLKKKKQKNTSAKAKLNKCPKIYSSPKIFLGRMYHLLAQICKFKRGIYCHDQI